MLEPVPVGGELGQFVDFGGHELVELMVQHPCERFALGWGDLNALVVLLDQSFDVGDEDRNAVTGGAFGVSAGADEVAVDVAVPVLRVGDGGPGWLYLVVLWAVWNSMKFIIMGPVSPEPPADLHQRQH